MPITNPYKAVIQVKRADFRRQSAKLLNEQMPTDFVKVCEKLCILSQAIDFYIGPIDEYETSYLNEIVAEFREAVIHIDCVFASTDLDSQKELANEYREHIYERCTRMSGVSKQLHERRELALQSDNNS